MRLHEGQSAAMMIYNSLWRNMLLGAVLLNDRVKRYAGEAGKSR